ncbi:lysylphosphatidylglycerol synthase transmembrane domain-containing protein [Ruegeria sp. 2205SS24-7]|uniref:lysylphosphatidylglycerol synthase transmembrane domain-containing protein n=1 Tax=Ruegeria discodermiae TaxID=3064389 RepID=UPI002740DD40|nr:lysylphosphatidylglycerol synthase transmembrane domain-containing protein [Ruegeria sp. 2205SS24-7]MDP5220865.1 lysylphosphatidylglycerol synthase transmembrane domain-containing protein [Ruegeria sp. 2205SS24-7]
MSISDREELARPVAKPARRKALLKFALKAVISAGLIAYILHTQVDNVDEIWQAISGADPWLLAAAFLLHILGFLLCSWRWQILLRAQTFLVPIIELIRAYAIGIFFNSFLPGVMSGDFMRALDISDRVPSYTQSLLILFVERLTGMIALLVLALIALPLIGWDIVEETGILWILVAVSAAVIVVSLTFLSNPFRRLATRVSEVGPFRRAQGIISKITETSAVFSGRMGSVYGCILISVVFQAIVVLHFYLIAQALGFGVPVIYYFALIPVSLFIMMVPISINGIGVREQAFIVLFGFFGVPASSAISLAWIALAFALAQAVAGGVVFALRRKAATS